MSGYLSGTVSDELVIEPADLRLPEAAALIARLTAELARRYEDDGAGDFRPSDLEKPGSGFLMARWAGLAVACGAFRPLAPGIGEIKRMYVEPDYRGRGIGRRMLAALEHEIRQAGYARIWLEAGIAQPEALGLYESAGYRRIAPYGYYGDDPRSICFEKRLAAAT